MTLTENDWKACDPAERWSGELPTKKLTLKDGHFTLYQERGGRRETEAFGTYRVFRDKFELTDGTGSAKGTALWSFDGRQLTLSHIKAEVGPEDCVGDMIWTSHPWVLTKASG
jgi:hypothetical protein